MPQAGAGQSSLTCLGEGWLISPPAKPPFPPSLTSLGELAGLAARFASVVQICSLCVLSDLLAGTGEQTVRPPSHVHTHMRECARTHTHTHPSLPLSNYSMISKNDCQIRSALFSKANDHMGTIPHPFMYLFILVYV